MNEPKSRKLFAIDANDYFITAAGWDSGLGYGECFEIGIRRKDKDGEFWLLQGLWKEASMEKVARAIVLMLNDGYTPTEIEYEIFR